LDRAAWRRIQFTKVYLITKGIQLDCTLSMLRSVVEYLKSAPYVTHHYGSRRPSSDIKSDAKARGDWMKELPL